VAGAGMVAGKMGTAMFVFALALVPFLIRLGYLLKFRFQVADGRPLRYAEMKAILTALTLLFVVIGAFILLLARNWVLAMVLVAACLLVGHLAKLYAYRRAVNETASWLTSLPVEQRRTVAVMQVDLAIKEGTRM